MEAGNDTRKLLLKQAGVSDDDMKFLSTVKIPLLYEWAYLCAVEGMPSDQIGLLIAKAEKEPGKASEIFKKERLAYLKENYENNRGLMSEVKELHDRVESMYKRAADVEGSLDETIKKTLRDKDRLYGEIIQAKDAMIRDKDQMIIDMKQDRSQMKDQISHLEDKLRTATIKLTSISSAKEISEDTEKKDILRERLMIHQKQETIQKDGFTKISEERYQKPLKNVKKKKRFFRPNKTAEQFISLFIDNDKFDDQQKDFLISCLEQGDSVEQIKNFAYPGLNLDQMKRIRLYMMK